MSRFGYLRTPLPDDASAAAQADAHACLLDKLGIERVAVFGASAGGTSSLEFALRHPQRVDALVLLVPAAYMPKPAGEPQMDAPASTPWVFDTALRFDFLFWAGIKTMPSVLTKALLATEPAVVAAAEPAEQARAKALLEGILPVSPRRPGLVNDAFVTSHPRAYEYESIAAPTLVISAADDLFGTYAVGRYVAERIPGARFIGYRDGGHTWIGHDAEMQATVVDFLNAAAARRTAQQ
jgi:pimeloyl-ACP methyl ester carboxylesterase